MVPSGAQETQSTQLECPLHCCAGSSLSRS